MEAFTIDSAALEGFLRQNGAQYVEMNEAGGYVYKAADGSTLVVYHRRGEARITRITNSCAC